MKHFTEEELLQEIAAGNRTLKGLGAKFGLSPNSIKSALTKLGISLKESKPEEEPIIMNDFSASEEDEWYQLHQEYDDIQAKFTIAYCRVKLGMTPAQARQYMKDNFHYQTIIIKLSK